MLFVSKFLSRCKNSKRCHLPIFLKTFELSRGEAKVENRMGPMPLSTPVDSGNIARRSCSSYRIFVPLSRARCFSHAVYDVSMSRRSTIQVHSFPQRQKKMKNNRPLCRYRKAFGQRSGSIGPPRLPEGIFPRSSQETRQVRAAANIRHILLGYMIRVSD